MRQVAAFLLLFVCAAAFAQSPFCGSDVLLDESLKADPALRQRLDALEAAIGAQVRLRHPRSVQTFSTPSYVIPVVVYVVYTSGLPVGTQENITDAQVQSQLTALNQAFSAQGISFCLATRDTGTGASFPGPTQGIIRVASPLTNHLTSQEAALKALSTLAGDHYLRIWVVKDIDNHSGVAGYARFPGTVPTTLEGVVMRYDFFGDIANCAGCPLIPNYDRGKILAHEVGHYLSLYHTFQGGCTGLFTSDCGTLGDQVCDTPQIATADSGCPSSTVISCNGTPALTNNEMDYTNDVCRTSFTTDQTSRMQAALSLVRSTLVSPQNLVATGISCTGGINASFSSSNYSPCPSTTVTLTALTTSGATYAWDFGDGSPLGSGNPVTHAYSVGGPRMVTLTVTSGSNSASSAQQLFVSNGCAPIASSQGNWYFGTNAGLNFASGTPVAVLNNGIAGAEACVSQSDAAGNLLFYSDSKYVFDKTHTQMPPVTQISGDNSASNGAIAVPDPGNSLRYYLFYKSTAGTLRYSIVDFSNGSFPNGHLVSVDTTISGSGMAEHITAIPKCNGVDYWVIAHQLPQTFLVYSVTASGVAQTGTYGGAIGGSGIGVLKASPDGTMLAQTSQTAPAGLYDFDRATGAITFRTNLPNGIYGISFSPDSKLLYTAGSLSAPNGAIYQYDLTASNPATTSVVVSADINAPFGFVSLELGPDKKIYASGFSSYNHLQVINYPNSRDTLLAPNACGYSFNGPSLQGKTTYIGLPNMIDALPPAQIPASISSTISSCSTVAFHAPSCATYSWNFGDFATSSVQNPTHTYSSNGTYTVTLTLNGTTTLTESITIGLPQSVATIYGPSTVCLSSSNTGPFNYSAVAQTGLTYQWSVTGGAVSGPNTNNNADVVWSTLPGTVQLTVTDAVTGCSTTKTITVTQSCNPNGCVTPPAGLVDWWTFDESSGPAAHDIAGYADDAGTYAGGAAPVTGLIGNAIDFNGTGAHLEVANAPEVNFFGGCIVDVAEPVTIDLWVKTNIASGNGPTSGLMTILDKRVVGSGSVAAFGYSLFLFNGRLGFQMDSNNFVAPASGVNYIDVADNQWHFIAVVVTMCRGPADGFLYVDGKNVLSLKRALGFVNSAKLYIGERDPAFGANYFHGSLDELEIFKAVLTEDQLRSIFEARANGKCKVDCSLKNLAIAPQAMPVLARGVFYTAAVAFTASGGTAPYTFGFAGGNLPPGMSISSNGILSGTPSASGAYGFSVATIDADGCRFIKAYVLVVVGKHWAVKH